MNPAKKKRENKNKTNYGDNDNRERRLALFCAVLSLACLAAIALFVRSTPPIESDVALLSSQDEGSFIAATGKLAAPRYSASAGSFSGMLCQSACISFFVSPQLANEITSTRIDLRALRSGAKIRVEGVLHEDAWGLEIEVATPNGLELLSS
ncbi:MAG: hypothetical protein V1817_00960 [Candidatus Micrarchaeota archaeon]